MIDLQRPEAAHASVGVLAASPLTVRSKRKSAALRADFSFVADWVCSPAVLLRAVAGWKETSCVKPRLS
jgi:hypothetical protein